MTFPYDPDLAQMENRGYGRGTGNLILPNGTFVAVSQEEAALEFNGAAARECYRLWLEHIA